MFLLKQSSECLGRGKLTHPLPLSLPLFLSRVDGKLDAAEEKGLTKAGNLLLKEIQREAGHYQDSVHGLPAWEELSDVTKAERVKAGYTPNDPLLRSGGLKDSYKSEVEDRTAVVGSEDPIAGYVETGHDDEGHGRLPPRPIVGGSLFRRVDDVVAALVEPTMRALEGRR